MRSQQAHDGEVGAGTPAVEYAYDDAEANPQIPVDHAAPYVRLTGVTYPNGRVATYHYATGIDDKLSRLSRIADESDATTYASYTYLGTGTVVQVAHPAVSGGLTLTYGAAGDYGGWDRFGRVVDQKWQTDDQTPTFLDRFQYTYDGNSNRLTRDVTATGAPTNLNEVYEYDGLDRLADTDRGGSDFQQWSLDGLGNWCTFTDQGLTQTRDHDEANQLTGISGTGGADWVDPAYDDAGNMISGPKPGAGTTELKFVYDAWNRLVKVTDSSDVAIAEYRYDGQGRRIQRTVDETTDDYYYNEGGQVLEVRRGGEENPLEQYVWDIRYVDAPVVRFYDGNLDGDVTGGAEEGDSVLYYATDANFSVTALVDGASGAVVERYVYDAYGKVSIFTGARDEQGNSTQEWQPRSVTLFDNQILYCGYRKDPVTGLYHTDTREYDAYLGRWLGRDSGGYIDGMNLYQYVSGNPTGLVDPSGLCGGTAPDPDAIRLEQWNNLGEDWDTYDPTLDGYNDSGEDWDRPAGVVDNSGLCGGAAPDLDFDSLLPITMDSGWIDPTEEEYVMPGKRVPAVRSTVDITPDNIVTVTVRKSPGYDKESNYSLGFAMRGEQKTDWDSGQMVVMAWDKNGEVVTVKSNRVPSEFRGQFTELA